MPLPAFAETLEGLPEPLREHYVETEDGRFRLDTDGLEDVSGLKSALEKERTARRALKAELAALKPSDEPAAPEADEAPEAEAPKAEAPDAEPEQPAPETAEPDQPDPDPAADPVPNAETEALRHGLIAAEARAAVLAARGSAELLLPVVLPRLRVATTEDGGSVVQVVDETGAPLRQDGEGSAPLTVADLIDRLRADPLYARAFDGSGKAGSGAPTAGRGGGGAVTVSLSDPRSIARHVADIAAGRVRVV